MVEYPPYVDSYGQLKELFKKLQEAAVPPKVTNDFLYTKLGLKSTSYRAMIPLMRKIGFIDQANVPTQDYRDYRDLSKSKLVMAKRIRASYSDLFQASEYAYNLTKDDLINKLMTLIGVSKDDKTVPKVAATFMELCKLADFEGTIPSTNNGNGNSNDQEKYSEVEKIESVSKHKLGISYTINLNLPATNDPSVFNAIFKSLKENLLK